MLKSHRIGALDIAGAISERIGSYVDMYSIEFLAVDGDRIHCWYQHPANDGPTFAIALTVEGNEWALQLTEQLPGAEQNVEIP